MFLSQNCIDLWAKTINYKKKLEKSSKNLFGIFKIISRTNLEMVYLPRKQKKIQPENGKIVKFGIFYEKLRSFGTFEAFVWKISKRRKSDGHLFIWIIIEEDIIRKFHNLINENQRSKYLLPENSDLFPKES